MGAMLVRHEPASAAAVRREIALDLDLCGVDKDAIDDVTLVASELVGNAVRHGSTGAEDTSDGAPVTWTVAWSLDVDEVVVSVEDPNKAVPVPRHVGPDSPNGRGLAIVTALSSAWGVEPTNRGKRVWARVRVG